MSRKIAIARTSLVLDQPFFGALICNLNIKEDPTCSTAWTDGTSLGYNPSYVESLTHQAVLGLLCHEVLHCVGGHPYRRDSRHPKKWNVACDMAINPIVKESGFTLPDGSLQTPAQWIGKSAEYIFDRLPDMEEGEGEGVPGEVRDSPGGSPSDEDGEVIQVKTEGEWSEITKQAAQSAKAQGNLPASMQRFCTTVEQAKVDWKSALRRFVQTSVDRVDYTWTKPNSRYASMGLYLPALYAEVTPKVAIGVDTSGSIDAIALSKAQAETVAVMEETRPSSIDILYADAAVAKIDTFTRGEEIEFQPAGGGGTDFRPVFEACEKMDEIPACIIYITDMYGTFPESSTIPTMWVTETMGVIPPFGEVIIIT